MSFFQNIEDYLKGLHIEKMFHPERAEQIDAEVTRVVTAAEADTSKVEAVAPKTPAVAAVEGDVTKAQAVVNTVEADAAKVIPAS